LYENDFTAKSLSRTYPRKKIVGRWLEGNYSQGVRFLSQEVAKMERQTGGASELSSGEVRLVGQEIST